MAAPNLPVLHSPHFHSAVERQLSSLTRSVERAFAEAQLTECFWDDEHCSCRAKATVHHLESELEFCARHFAQWEREGRRA